jgi:type I restriction enzyme S subunit
LGRGTTFIELGTLDLGNFTISFPPIPEQQSIAAFLDEKCSSVDSIIANMKKQVEILQQYTTSLITETVTKGLDKSAPMKNSGIEWIGKIPAHWEVKKIRYLGTLQNGITKDGGSFGSGFPFVSYSDVYNNTLLPSSVNGLVESTKNEQSLYSVKKDDAFFTRTSETIEEIGFSSVCESTIINATFAGFLIRFRPTSDELNMMFAKYYFRADILRSFFVKEMMIVTRSSLSQSLLNNLFVILPPLNEQKQIHDYIKDKCTRIDNIIAEKCQSIETIKAYKKSLIYEYVTGKKRIQGGKIK